MITWTIETEFDFGDKVTNLCNTEFVGVVTEYELKPKGLIAYVVTWADGTISSHYDFELKTYEFYK